MKNKIFQIAVLLVAIIFSTQLSAQNAKAEKQITPANAAIVLVDHQPGVLAMASSLPAKTITTNTAVLAKLGEELGIPLVITSTRENLDFLGTNFVEIQKAAPKAYASRIKRAGTLNAFDDKAFVSAVKNTGRPNLIMAGLITDVCLFHSVSSAIKAGYKVYVVADASGSTTTLADAVTYDRMRDMGAIITTTFGVLFELYPNLAIPAGQKAEGIASGAFAQ
ncbi:nicotinamidase-related amidase [Flavobacterium araucananum]|nr:nicotinamidase-related amidase [Flavobacterium araucananum]